MCTKYGVVFKSVTDFEVMAVIFNAHKMNVQ